MGRTLVLANLAWGKVVPLDGASFDGGRHGSRWCRSCKLPILKNQPEKRVEFQTDPDGTGGLTGDYHLECSKPFVSLAYVVNLNPWGGC
jgi:hypothetical protein